MREFLEKVEFVASAIDDACNGGPQTLNSQSFLQLHDYGSNWWTNRSDRRGGKPVAALATSGRWPRLAPRARISSWPGAAALQLTRPEIRLQSDLLKFIEVVAGSVENRNQEREKETQSCLFL